MSFPRKLLGCIVVLGVGMIRAAWAEPNAESIDQLPPNAWRQIDEKMSGNRIGAKVRWLPIERKLVVEGGLAEHSERESKKPKAMLFDPATNKWEEYRGEPKLPEDPAKLIVWDRARRFKAVVDLPYGQRDLAGERVAKNSPLPSESQAYVLNDELPAVVGSLSFFDPLHTEVHLIGGSAPGTAGGKLGNWRYSFENSSWLPAPEPPQAVAKVTLELRRLLPQERAVVADARNLFYAGLAADEESTRTKETLAKSQMAIVAGFASLVEQVRQLQNSPGCDREATSACAELLSTGAEQALIAGKAFAAGQLDATGIADAEDAAWRIDEAIAALATSPPPRRYASGVFDPKANIYYLFGGDHGDYTLGDIWTYDCASRVWQRHWLKSGPQPRFSAQLFWLPQAERVALLSGRVHLPKMRYQAFDECTPPDVWCFNPKQPSWSLLVDPGPEAKKLSRDSLPVFLVNNPAVVTEENVLICPAVGGNDYHDFMISSTWMARLDPQNASSNSADKESLGLAQRMYRSQKAQAYNPQWYDAAPRGKTTVVDQLLATLPANQWIEMPLAERPCPERSWGTCVFDPVHDQLFCWSGGHCADPADIVHHFHPGINRWSIGYVAGGGVLGNQLTGRPDCNNHTYHNFTWDPVSKKMVAVQRAGTHVYDPERRDWTAYCAEQPFIYDTYYCKVIGTKHGVVGWCGGMTGNNGFTHYFGVFDVASNRWSPLPVTAGKVPPNVHGDEAGIAWDPKRDVLYLFAAKTYEKGEGRVHKYDFATGAFTILEPKNRESIGDKFHQYRETELLPDLDMVLFGMRFLGNREPAYDIGNDRWVTLGIPRESRMAEYDEAKQTWKFAPAKLNDKVGSITFAPTLDPKRGVLWAPSDYQAMFVLKIDPKTLQIVESGD